MQTSGMWAAIRAIHRAAHLTIAVSPATATELVEAGACDRKAVKVWPKAVDCDLFHPGQASQVMRARLAGGSPSGPAPRLDGPLLLYVGRVSPEKNLALLRPLLERVPGARLAVVGDGPAMQEVQAELAGAPVTFLGRLSGRELAAAYASADIFVMTSESETLGNVVGEAMASGLPVVAAAAGGVPSVIGRPGTTGILFPPGDAAAAAAAVRRLAADASARRRMGRAARAEMERWSWRAATRELLRRHYPAALAAWRQQEGGAWALSRQAAA
jgi:sulfoquinovosyltransferase